MPRISRQHPSRPKNQGDELPPGAGLTARAFSRFAGLRGAGPLPRRRRAPFPSRFLGTLWSSTKTPLMYLKICCLLLAESTERTVATRTNARTWMHLLLKSWDARRVKSRLWGWGGGAWGAAEGTSSARSQINAEETSRGKRQAQVWRGQGLCTSLEHVWLA